MEIYGEEYRSVSDLPQEIMLTPNVPATREAVQAINDAGSGF